MGKTKDKKQKRKTASAKRRAVDHKTGFTNTILDIPEGMEYYKLEDEKPKLLDIVPYEMPFDGPYADEGELHYELTYYMHRDVGADKNGYVCPQKTFGKPCPICEYRAELAKDPEAEEKLVKDLRPKQRQLFYIINRDSKEKAVQLWDFSFHLFGKQLDQMIKDGFEDEGLDYFHDPEPKKGKSLKLGIEEKVIGKNKFFEVASITFLDRKKGLADSALEKATYPGKLLKEMGYKELKRLFLQEPKKDKDKSKDNFPEDEKPSKEKKKKKGKKDKGKKKKEKK